MTGVLCGSTYLNRGLRKVLEQRLATENYLRDLDQILDNAMKDFDDIKREFDGTKREHFTIPGLKPNEKKGFKANRLWLSRYTWLRSLSVVLTNLAIVTSFEKKCLTLLYSKLYR
jgi:hypothetical protein